MSWETENALKRVYSFFKRAKERKTPIWDNDIESLKLLSEELKTRQKSNAIDNVLFLKLVSVVLRERSEHYGDVKMAIKTISDDLNIPLIDNIELLRISLNHTDFLNYLKSIGVNLETYQNQDNIIKQNQKDFIQKLKTNWSIENIEKSLYNTTNSFIKDINNYK